ncbi:lanthionine synthetase C family protein [Actinophytocola sediminis]
MAGRVTTHADLAACVERCATQLARPGPPHESEPWSPQSLSKGAAGIALLHIERAHAGHGTWAQAHRWITHAVAGPISSASDTGLYLGAPAITFMLAAAAAGDSGHYRDALTDVNGPVTALAHHRATAAMARIAAGRLPAFREYDIFFGLSGIGALLLRRDPAGSALERILDYLVALTRPLRRGDDLLPGWWVGHDPHRRRSAAYPGGHANLGAAHGIAGPLALLSRAARHGITVTGHQEAIATICAWLDDWEQYGETGPWWPEWLTLADNRGGRPSQPGPARPSWCYGTPGIARAGQLAGIATGDAHRQRRFEQALLGCLADPAQQASVTDSGLCHGWAGIYHTVWRAAHDATTEVIATALAGHLPRLAANLGPAAGPGFLEGAAGTALVMHTAAHQVAPISGWDACLLID